MKDQHFAQAQHRRAQTEGRIAIFKNEFLGKTDAFGGLREPSLASGLGSADARFVGVSREIAGAAKDPGAET